MSSFNYMPPSFIATQEELALNTNIVVDEDINELIASHNKNCMVLGSADNVAPFTKAKLIFQITGNIFEGNTITLTSAEMGQLILTAKDTPSILEFKTTASPATATQIAEDIARALNDSIIFNRFYVASAFTPTVVTIEALTTGSRFTLAFDSVGSFVPLGGGSPGQDEFRAQELDNYGLYVDIFIGEGQYGAAVDKSNMQLIGSIEKKYNSANSFEMDVAGLISDYTTTPPPEYQNAFVAQFKSILPFVVLSGETYSEGGQFRRKFLVRTEAIKWALNAAVDITNYCTKAGLEPYIGVNGASSVCWLTNQPNKIVTVEAFESLSLLIKESDLDLVRIGYITITPTFRDGAVGAEEIVYANQLLKGGIYSFNTSPQNLPLDSIQTVAGKKIVSYSIQMRYATTLGQAANPLSLAPVLTKPQVYELIEPCESTQISFLNSLGCFDTMEFIGEDLQSLSRSVTTSFTSIPCCPNKASIIRGLKQAQVEDVRTVNTGWIAAEEYKWLLELAASAETYEVLEDGSIEAIVLDSVRMREDSTTNKFFVEVEFFKSAPYNSVTK